MNLYEISNKADLIESIIRKVEDHVSKYDTSTDGPANQMTWGEIGVGTKLAGFVVTGDKYRRNRLSASLTVNEVTTYKRRTKIACTGDWVPTLNQDEKNICYYCGVLGCHNQYQFELHNHAKDTVTQRTNRGYLRQWEGGDSNYTTLSAYARPWSSRVISQLRSTLIYGCATSELSSKVIEIDHGGPIKLDPDKALELLRWCEKVQQDHNNVAS